MNFIERMPDACPPSNSSDKELKNVCRFLPFKNENDEKNYYSMKQLGRPKRGNATDCTMCSVSLFYADGVPSFLDVKKMSFFRKCKIAVLNIPSNSGKSVEDDKRHVDFWGYQGFDYHSCVQAILDSADDLEDLVD
ncbi:MAG: hypothetical protein ABF628_04450 [Acetobacter orientalis]|uniref:hypothetical protein n=1 Tax=Acetobacter orientalis TaxID=146474 RepID=UPI0039EB28C3